MKAFYNLRCCLCGAEKPSFHNPDPLREGAAESCCEECNNLLVRPFRERVWALPRESMETENLRLRQLSYEELTKELTET